MIMPNIVSNWRQAWRWHSIRLSTLGAVLGAIASAVNAIYGDMSPITRAGWPTWVEPLILAGIFVGVLVGRLVDQS